MSYSVLRLGVGKARVGRHQPSAADSKSQYVYPILGTAPIGEPYISITIGICFENSSDLRQRHADRGARRPAEPESDEFSKSTTPNPNMCALYREKGPKRV
eukprot:4066363-Prymnesium_polylepis.1